jgi:hypothetical protein
VKEAVVSEYEHSEEQQTLPDESPTAGEAAEEKGGVETEGPKEAKSGEGHPAREHDDPSN